MQCDAGEWSGRLVAIKTMVFQCNSDQVVQAASETAIASNLAHPNVVTTYCHDLHHMNASTELVSGSHKLELRLYKLYLIQVRFDSLKRTQHHNRDISAPYLQYLRVYTVSRAVVRNLNSNSPFSAAVSDLWRLILFVLSMKTYTE